MSRQAIIQQIMQQLTESRVPCTSGQGTDIAVAAEFVDASWGTGRKRINYEAAILVDEPALTVLMWEKTVETGSGISGGFSGDSSFQSGTTLMRKVKSIQYGPDGKVYEYDLNLGAIPKIAKDAAKAFNWRFRTVLQRDKALYPAGFAQPTSAAAANAAAAAASSASRSGAADQARRFCTHCGVRLREGAVFCSNCGAKLT